MEAIERRRDLRSVYRGESRLIRCDAHAIRLCRVAVEAVLSEKRLCHCRSSHAYTG